MANHDLIVIGGGLIGSATAWGASRTGADVVLLDEGDTAFRAARGNFGLIWLQGKGVGNPPYMHWSLRAGKLWRSFVDELSSAADFDIGWREAGGLHFCFSEADLEKRKAVIAQSRADNGDIEIEMLDRADLSSMVAGLGPDVLGASYSPSDSHVSPLYLLRALQRALQEAGGTYRPGFPATEIIARDNHFIARSKGSEVRGKSIVVAAGLGSASLSEQIGISMPVKPQRGQIVVTERMAPFFPYAGSCVRQTVEGSILLGSSHDAAVYDEGTDVATVAGLCKTAVRVFPRLADVNIVRSWGSLRVMTPDGLPVYEESEHFPGAFAVTCHSGVTLTSVHALEIGPALAAGKLPEAVSSFRSSRFDVQAP